MLRPNLTVERSLWLRGLNRIAGIDEVGRGSWAGPLVAAGIILPQTFKVPKDFADSKQLNKKQREEFDEFLKRTALTYKIVEISSSTIARIGVGRATQVAFRKIVKSLQDQAEHYLIDAFPIKRLAKGKQSPIKHGDELCASIAAASIIAKVYRDSLMEAVSKKFPNYGFEKHKGYGTQAHQIAIKKYGFCKIHRTSYNLDFLFS